MVIIAIKRPFDSLVSSNAVNVWIAKIPYFEKKLQKHWEVLAIDEQLRAQSFLKEDDRARYIISRFLVRKMLASQFSTFLKEIRFGYNPFGKPFIANPEIATKLHFNISHSHQAVVLAFSFDVEVGIDVEHLRPIQYLNEVSNLCFSPQEKMHWESLPNHFKLNWFYKCWTMKEAYVKGLGLGLSQNLQSLTIPLMHQNKSWVLNDPEQRKWTVYEMNLLPNYACAVAAKGQNFRLVLSNITE